MSKAAAVYHAECAYALREHLFSEVIDFKLPPSVERGTGSVARVLWLFAALMLETVNACSAFCAALAAWLLVGLQGKSTAAQR